MPKDITHIKDLKFDPKNARVHTERNISVIAEGMQEVGAGRSILIDKDGEIIAGNGVVEAAAQVGITKVRVIEADGNEIIAVRRSDLTGKKKIRAALLDNRAQEVGGTWNTDVLKDMVRDDETMLKGLWSNDEVDALLEKQFNGEAVGEDPLSPVSRETAPDSNAAQRLVLWVAKDRYEAVVKMLRTLGDRYGLDDFGDIFIRAVEEAYDSGIAYKA